jgi:hypothetical protein
MNSICLILFSQIVLTSFEISGKDVECVSSEYADCGREGADEVNVKFRGLPTYENSYIRDPIEKEPVNSRPNDHESSFYEQLTR